MGSEHKLEIIATGRKCAQSHGAQVWFGSLRVGDGEFVPLAELELGQGWHLVEEGGVQRLYADGENPATLSWTGVVDGPARLELGIHPWSGIALIRWNGQEQVIDLYGHSGVRGFELSDEDSVGRKVPTSAISAFRGKEQLYSADAQSMSEFANPAVMLADLWTNRRLIRQFAVREVIQRYRGSYLGAFWSLITPLCMLAVYTFVFGVLFKSRWGAIAGDSQLAFGLTLFCGLIVFGVFSEAVSRAPSLIVASPNFVKKVAFPLQVLPSAAVVSSLINASFSFSILLCAMLVSGHPLSPSVLLFPLSLIPLVALTLGMAWFLASLGVFIRDISHVVSLGVMVLLFMSAIFYPPSIFPPTLQTVAQLNPILVIVDSARRTLMLGQQLDWAWWGGVTLVSLLAMQLGYMWFMKTKRWFADVV